jgi:hypothetical protein
MDGLSLDFKRGAALFCLENRFYHSLPFILSAAAIILFWLGLLRPTTARINYYELFKIRKRIIKSLSFIPK